LLALYRWLSRLLLLDRLELLLRLLPLELGALRAGCEPGALRGAW
jgi:hypothetical protein